MVKVTRQMLIDVHDAIASQFNADDELRVFANLDNVDLEDLAEFADSELVSLMAKVECKYQAFSVTLCAHKIIVIASPIFPTSDIYVHRWMPDAPASYQYTHFPYSGEIKDKVWIPNPVTKPFTPAIVEFDA